MEIIWHIGYCKQQKKYQNNSGSCTTTTFAVRSTQNSPFSWRHFSDKLESEKEKTDMKKRGEKKREKIGKGEKKRKEKERKSSFPLFQWLHFSPPYLQSFPSGNSRTRIAFFSRCVLSPPLSLDVCYPLSPTFSLDVCYAPHPSNFFS